MLTETMYKKLRRKIKNKEDLEDWLTKFGFANYLDGINDCRAATYRHLIDSFDWTPEQVAELRDLSRKDIGLINERYATANEILEQLVSEGYTSLKPGGA